MAIDPTTEPLIPAKQTPATVQDWTKHKNRISHATLNRWFTVGVGGVVLESVLIAGIRYTNHSALVAFFNDSARAKTRQREQPSPSSDGDKRRAAELEAKVLGI